MALLADTEFWIAVGVAIFAGILFWKRVPSLIARSLDARAAAIAKELQDAQRLREEAQGILADYKKKHAAAEQEAAAIVAEAKGEAERFARESEAAIAVQVARRAKQAEERIAQAEAQAVAEVRAMAADAAVSAAEKLIAARLDEKKSTDLIKRAMAAIPEKLN
jgi:F-type H+-transporting ATPase subunit b